MLRRKSVSLVLEGCFQDQNTLSQGMVKKGDDVAVDDDDDDAVRTSVSQIRVTVTLCIDQLFLRSRYI